MVSKRVCILCIFSLGIDFYTDGFFFLKNFFFNIFIFLAVPGLSCSLWDLVSWSGIKLPAWDLRVFATGLPGKSLFFSPQYFHVGPLSSHLQYFWWEICCNLYIFLTAAAAKLLQSCPTLCDPIDGSPPGSPVPGILQARTLEWVAISFSNEWKWKVKVKSLSLVLLFVTPWTAAYQAPPSMGFSRKEYWSGLPLPSP